MTAKIINKGSTFYLEIWKASMLDSSYNLTDFDLHGEVYFDKNFGSIALDPEGQKVAFVAEKKRPKSQPFFKPGAYFILQSAFS